MVSLICRRPGPNPMLASAAMALSSLFVVGNSLRLRRLWALSTRTS